MTSGRLLGLGLGLGLSLGACQTDPFAVDPPADCEVQSQNQFVVEVMDEFYLWTKDIDTTVDIGSFDSPEAVARALRVSQDRWTRVSDKATSDALFMQGKFVGFGYKTQRGADNEVRVSFVSDNSPASELGMVRGDVIAGVGGFTAEELDAAGTWSSIYGANEPGVTVEIDILKIATGEIETVSMTKEWIDIVSLPVAELFDGPGGGSVGYFVMDKFVETTKAELDGVFAMFKSAGASSVIIDLRYNGGGLISVAARVVDLVLGAKHAGSVAYGFQYNANHSAQNSSTKISKLGQSIAADKIVVLTSSRTLSASELVINALFPYAEVTLVGSATGGKPYGSKGFDFCEKRLFPITFRLVNAKGDSDYYDGLPADCFADDDLFHQLGDPDEAMLAAALSYLQTGACAPAPAAPFISGAVRARVDAVGEMLLPNADERQDIDSW